MVLLLAVAAMFFARQVQVVASEPFSVQQGQQMIAQGNYQQAIRVFSRLINDNPTDVEGYRGRIEAELLLGRYSDALRDYALITAFVLPVNSDATADIIDGYAFRLAENPRDIPALTGASFARWVGFEYNKAIQLLNRLLEIRKNDRYGLLFRGSSRMLLGANVNRGVEDLESALTLDPNNSHVRFIVADAYTYGVPDPQRALAEAMSAIALGLNTPRIQAILAAAYFSLGDETQSAIHIQLHIEMVTDELVTTAPLMDNSSIALDLVPGRTFELPVTVNAGETLSIITSSPSREIYDSILVLLDPDGNPVLGSDDFNSFFAGFEWTVAAGGTYYLQVTSFEGINTGELMVERN